MSICTISFIGIIVIPIEWRWLDSGWWPILILYVIRCNVITFDDSHTLNKYQNRTTFNVRITKNHEKKYEIVHQLPLFAVSVVMCLSLVFKKIVNFNYKVGKADKCTWYCDVGGCCGYAFPWYTWLTFPFGYISDMLPG